MNSFPVESFHTILFCRKWDECVSFYSDVLGFNKVDTKPGFVELQVSQGSHIGLLRRDRNNSLTNHGSSFILSFRVENLEETHIILAEHCPGISAIKEHSWGDLLFELKDPEGRLLEFWSSR